MNEHEMSYGRPQLTLRKEYAVSFFTDILYMGVYMYGRIMNLSQWLTLTFVASDVCIRDPCYLPRFDLAMTVTIVDPDRRNIQMMASIIATQLCNSKLYSASHLRTHYRQMHSDTYTSRNRKILSTTITHLIIPTRLKYVFEPSG